MANLADISRGEKLSIAKSIHQNLVDRAAKGPPEPGLDGYIKEVGDTGDRLEAHVAVKSTADPARLAMLDKLSEADAIVGTWVRRIVSFVEANVRRRANRANAAAAGALLEAAFPKRIEAVDDQASGQNVYCQAAIAALRSPEHQATLVAIGMPPAWIHHFEASIKESDALAQELLKAQGSTSAHGGTAKEAEAIWVDCMVRLRHYLHSRAKQGDAAKQIEGARIIEPLVVALKRRDVEIAAGATRRAKAAAAWSMSESSAATSSLQLA
jgi:hypothetical protein